jgi:hypothetical protein
MSAGAELYPTILELESRWRRLAVFMSLKIHIAYGTGQIAEPVWILWKIKLACLISRSNLDSTVV